MIKKEGGVIEKIGKSRTAKKVALGLAGAAIVAEAGILGLADNKAKASEGLKRPNPITQTAPEPTIGEAWSSENFPYVDVFKTAPYYSAVINLYKIGIIEGHEPECLDKEILEFRPSSPLTRAQFAKMMVKALEIPVSKEDISRFKDVPQTNGSDSLYPEKYIAAADKAGILKGKTEEVFAPYENVTMEQSVTAIIRGLKNKYPEYVKDAPESFVSVFDDYSNGPHVQSLRDLEFNILLKDIFKPSNEWKVQEELSRGDAAIIVDKLVLANSIFGWMKENNLNEFGDSKDTIYLGGTPLFNESTGEYVSLTSYLSKNHPEKPWIPQELSE